MIKTYLTLRCITMLLIAFSKPSIVSQSSYSSTILTDVKSWITIPAHCIVLGAEKSDHPRYFGRKFKIIKPPRKMHEYEDDIERGIEIGVRDGNGNIQLIRDISSYPDFSAQLMGIAISGLLYSLMFKLFG
ncbi:uncharacterized protein VICG_01248 [Vittaforma corneae ATCC 50505]|uniref:Uncharacterized protein n=1 Tax=Vittaforma corneae (strain ATCC 50505) TaxID=993615 RepID=L2GM83_VITCO|nr:uncharacterized protein VICG_01248 [Vittaforma corneae ATCC 50505]ELA41744.1 hypothetical protein VICG_01248 [Vittaforma corneae ATCC 50505]